MNLYYGNENNMNPNLLVIHIQPDEGITLYLNAKKLGGAAHAQPIKLDYCSNCNDELNTLKHMKTNSRLSSWRCNKLCTLG